VSDQSIRPIPPSLRNRVTLSVAEVAETLGLSERTVEQLVARGEFRSTKLGGRRLVLAASIWEALGLSWPANPLESEDPELAAIADREIPRGVT
jgi:excisionase family DNA binding protein